ncbi:MAG: AraC family transcriptional regulator [Spirochaetota bacterium]
MAVVWPRAIILHANHAVVTEHIGPHGPVRSRMLLWCNAGSGYITVNGERYAISPQVFFFLPWDRMIRYHPSGKRPLLLGGIHIIPDHTSRKPVYEIAHSRRHALFQDASRRDRGEFPGIVEGRPSAAMLHSAEYIVSRWQRGGMIPALARSLAAVVMDEIVNCVDSDKNKREIPQPIRELAATVDSMPAEGHDIDSMRRACSMSRSTLTRLFKRHYGISPMQYVLRARIARAAELLATTTMPVASVGEASGIPDQYHFSRMFKQLKGVPPRVYRERNGI